MASPLATSSWASYLRASSPLKVMAPSRGRSSPVMVRRVVVFPAPLPPMRQTISPSSTVMETPFKAWMLP